MKSKRFTHVLRVRLTSKVVDRLERLADNAGTSKSDVVRRLIVQNAAREERKMATTSERQEA